MQNWHPFGIHISTIKLILLVIFLYDLHPFHFVTVVAIFSQLKILIYKSKSFPTDIALVMSAWNEILTAITVISAFKGCLFYWIFCKFDKNTFDTLEYWLNSYTFGEANQYTFLTRDVVIRCLDFNKNVSLSPLKRKSNLV